MEENLFLSLTSVTIEIVSLLLLVVLVIDLVSLSCLNSFVCHCLVIFHYHCKATRSHASIQCLTYLLYMDLKWIIDIDFQGQN